MSIQSQLPSYKQLFGNLDFRQGQNAKSVYSPAAYLADLLQLLDDTFKTPDLHQRRPDIKSLLLSEDNTFGTTPYLGIVNDILQTRLLEQTARIQELDPASLTEEDLWNELMPAATYPLAAPFDLGFERARLALHLTGVGFHELYNTFDVWGRGDDIRATLFLGLSSGMTGAILGENDWSTEEAARWFQLSEPVFASLPVSRFMQVMGCSGLQVRELLYGQLSGISEPAESGLVANFFIHQGLGGVAQLSSNEESIVWSREENIPLEWINRTQRLFRLHQATGLSISDLSLFLATLCGNQLDRMALQKLAVLRSFQQQTEWEWDVIVAVFGELNTRGLGNDDQPHDLFNRIFNGHLAELDGRYLAGSEAVHPAFASLTPLLSQGDLLLPANRALRERIRQALGMSNRDLTACVEFLRSRAASRNGKSLFEEPSIGLPALSLLFRLSKLAEWLDISPLAVLQLVQAIDRDPAIREFNPFRLLVQGDYEEQDAFEVLANGPVDARLWLIQMVVAVGFWAQKCDLQPDALLSLVKSRADSEEENTTTSDLLRSRLQQWHDAFGSVAFQEEQLITGVLDGRSARNLHRQLRSAGIVSRLDSRLLGNQPESLLLASEKAMASLRNIEPEDFMNLGLEANAQAKFFRQLRLRGVLTIDNQLDPSKLPATPSAFVFAESFSQQRQAIFDLIATTVTEAQETEAEAFLFPSSFEPLGLSGELVGELYDHLQFGGLVAADGQVVEPGWFLNSSNAGEWQVDNGLGQWSEAVYHLIQARQDRFRQTPVLLNRESLGELGLAPVEEEALIQNLRANGYIDEDGQLLQKDLLARLRPDEFLLSLQFLRHKKQILTWLQAPLREQLLGATTWKEEDFAEMGARFAGQRILQSLEGNYLKQGRLTEDASRFFADEANQSSFDPGTGFSSVESASVFQAIRRIDSAIQQLFFSPFPLEALGFTEEEIGDWEESLVTRGLISEDGAMPAGQVAYFLDSSHALDFEAEGYEDYRHELFFLLQDQAMATSAWLEEAKIAVTGIAAAQLAQITDTFSEMLELEEATGALVFERIFGHLSWPVEAIMAPVLAAADAQGRIRTLPKSYLLEEGLRRSQRLATLVSTWGLDLREAIVVLDDQSLVEKMGEPLLLPDGLDAIDAVLAGMDSYLYVFRRGSFWKFDGQSHAWLEGPLPLTALSALFAGIDRVNATFVDPAGTAWVLAGTDYFRKEAGSNHWVRAQRSWDSPDSHFDKLSGIDAAFSDQEGKTYLFAGDQYVRYSSDLRQPDEGYPRTISSSWAGEIGEFPLPASFHSALDAGVHLPGGEVLLFKGDHYISSDAPEVLRSVRETLGKVANRFLTPNSLNAALSLPERTLFFAGKQAISYTQDLEREGVLADEGSLVPISRLFPNLPKPFHEDIDAAFHLPDGTLHFFHGEQAASLDAEGLLAGDAYALTSRWGLVKNAIEDTGKVDAALNGLDGRVYLFSGTQFYRYSGTDFSRVDEGYPRSISTHWAGVQVVDSAVVLEGKTYLFGRVEVTVSGVAAWQPVMVRYSGSDYSQPDPGYPDNQAETFWSLPFRLVEEGFSAPDCMFIGPDQHLYLFLGSRFVDCDLQDKQRWWSEPKDLAEDWDSLPFSQVTAAFTDKRGRSYLFGYQGTDRNTASFVRYSGPGLHKVDDRFPKPVAEHWGKVANHLRRSERVDAAVTLLTRIPQESLPGEQPSFEEAEYTYLFSGPHFYRYTNLAFQPGVVPFVDEGYPKTIASSLGQEPRFTHLDLSGLDEVEAVFGDLRQVMVLRNGQIRVASAEASKQYTRPLPVQAETALVDAGSLYLHDGESWWRMNYPEARQLVLDPPYPVTPPSLSALPADQLQGVAAVLHGLDKNTYLFRGGNCYDESAEELYPVGEAWGRQNTAFERSGSLDSALWGADGRVYLFSGDEFVSYQPAPGQPGVIPLHAESLPGKIADRFFGLTNVWISFVEANITYLIETPDDSGRFRYARMAGSRYDRPEGGALLEADFSFWGIPSVYVKDGFTRVDAALVRGGNRFLFMGNSFIQFNFQEEQWTYARPVGQFWRGIQVEGPGREQIRSLLPTPDGGLYFFFDNTFQLHHHDQVTAPAGIVERWGRVRNVIREENRVDAAFVYRGQYTYLFAGDQFVRYQGGNYEFVEPGYPKSIVTDLRREPGFGALPVEWEADMERYFAAEKRLEAIFENDGTIYLLLDGQICALSQSLQRSLPVERIGRLKNNLAAGLPVQAALAMGSHIYLFSGDQAFRYEDRPGPWVEEGYPVSLRQALENELGVSNLPAAFADSLDAAFCLHGGEEGPVYLFKGEQFYHEGMAAPQPIHTMWASRSHSFQGTESEPNVALDAGFLAPDGRLYLFKGGQYLRLSDPLGSSADEGWPKAIRDNWGDLPPHFEQGITGGFVLAGRTYLVLNEEYVRFSDQVLQRIDPTCPQPFDLRWKGWNDLLLGDLQTIHRFKQLQESSKSGGSTLVDFLHDGPGYHVSPYQLLGEILGHDKEDIRWIKRMGAFLVQENAAEERFGLEEVLRTDEIIRMANRMGTFPEDLWRTVWMGMFEQDAPDFGEVADRLESYLGRMNSRADWGKIQRQLLDALNTRKRDVMVPLLIQLLQEERQAKLAEQHSPRDRRLLEQEGPVETARDLYERLLIDVEMASCGETSPLVEATAAVQLYFHRFFVNLETIDNSIVISDELRQSLKERWKWLRNYRVWEANRKVFLYPENYLRPELRGSKTPAFKALEEDLMQGELSEANVEKAYKKYLDEFTEVSRLAISGGYVFDDPNSLSDKRLVLFGRAKTDPIRYYYRFATFANGETNAAVYEPWQKVNIQIESERVSPVFAFGRTFVFWGKIEESVVTSNASARAVQNGNETSMERPGQIIHSLKLFFSFINLNGEWIQPQKLDARLDGNGQPLNIVEKSPILSFSLFVENSENIQGHPHENIVVHVSYQVQGLAEARSKAFRLTPELVVRRAERPDFRITSNDVARSIFGPAEEIKDSDIVLLNTYESSSEGPWFTIDHKGGSFLIKPTEATLGRGRVLSELQGNTDNLPEWARIDAAASIAGKDLFFNNTSRLFQLRTTTEVVQGDTTSRWGRVDSQLGRTGRVDAAWRMNGKTYLATGGEYLRYQGQDRVAEKGSPFLLSNNPDGIPAVSSVDAALEGLDNQFYFFANNLSHGKEQVPVREKWGRKKNEFTEGKAYMDAAFVAGDHTYLISKKNYLRYTGTDYLVCDEGYPKAVSLRSVLLDLGCTNIGETDKNSSFAIHSAYNEQGIVFLQTTGGNYRVENNLVSQDPGQPGGMFSAFSGPEGLVRFFSKEFDWGGTRLPMARDINAAFVSKKGILYLFSDSGSTWITIPFAGLTASALQVAINSFSSFRQVKQDWGLEPNTITKESRVDAAFVIGKHTFLVAGDQYVRYSGSKYDFIEAGYPKLLASNTDNLPAWDGMDAALRFDDQELYFFRGEEHVRHGRLTATASNRQVWSRIHNHLIDSGNVHAAYTVALPEGGERLYLISGSELYAYTLPEDGEPRETLDPGYPKQILLPQQDPITAAFVRGDNLFLISQNSFLVCPKDDIRSLRQGYPKTGRLGELMTDLWSYETFAEGKRPAPVPAGKASLPVHGAYVEGDWLHLHSHGYTFALHLPSGAIQDLDNSRFYFEAAYRNKLGQVVKLKNEDFSAATEIGGRLLLIRGDEFVLMDHIPDAFPALDWWNQQPKEVVSQTWGIASVDAAFHLNGHLYLFAQDKYYRLPPDAEPLDLLHYQFRSGNWANIPQEMSLGIDAALDKDGLLYFFRGDEYIRYSLDEKGKPQPYEVSDARFDIVRLTAGTSADLNRILFTKGLDGLLSKATQQIDESPGFTYQNPTTTQIQVNFNKVDYLPTSSHLDFDSPNGIYYEEIFFHAPFLLAQMLNTDQKFEAARRWYEFIYDPTEAKDYWKYLPFLSADVQGLIDGLDGVLQDLEEMLGTNGVRNLRGSLESLGVMATLEAVKPAFAGSEVIRVVSSEELGSQKWKRLAALSELSADLGEALNLTPPTSKQLQPAFAVLQNELLELVLLIERLAIQYRFMLNHRGQINTYLNDPFDPHAIAALRKIAYRKAIIMRYVDNLLDWGDLLFAQFTMESVNEARMLYLLAYDLLGKKPESIGTRPASPDRSFESLFDIDNDYDFLLYLESGVTTSKELSFAGTVHDSMLNTTYFHVPENEQFIEYWDRVEDRLYKIRNCLNLMGVRESLSLFAPAIDPNALVAAAAGGGGFASALAAGQVTLPHYRYSFLLQKAQALVQKAMQFGGELLAALEKKDAEALNQLQHRHEGEVLNMLLKVKEAQLEEAKETTLSLKVSKEQAAKRKATYDQWQSNGMNAGEIVQVTLMGTAVALHVASALMKGLSGIAHLIPDSKLGVFILGVDYGGRNVGDSLDKFGEAVQSAAEGLSIGGELAGMIASHERMKSEWKLQRDLAGIDERQIDHQIKGAVIQEQIASMEISHLLRQIDQNRSVETFMKGKFTNEQLYQWMAGRLAGVFFQTYQLALDMAKAAERALVFERGLPEQNAQFIKGAYWDSQRKGLMAGEALGLDLDRLDQMAVTSDARALEISRNVSLLEIDPLAFISLVNTGVCEFALTEAMFDYDFPGHYLRQIKTIAVSFGVEEGVMVNATLTQLSNRLVLEPDAKAVKFLLEPKDLPPASIRSNWRTRQQIALSHRESFEPNNGLFELRFDSERYLPFEGTGAVSNWRLELNGKKGAFQPQTLKDVVIQVKYTAKSGGEPFANAVKGMLKPYVAAHLIDVATQFPAEWEAFLEEETADLVLPMTRDLLPHLASGGIPALLTQMRLTGPGNLQWVLNEDPDMVLRHGRLTETPGLNIGAKGSTWTLTLQGDKSLLAQLKLVVMYKAKVV